jgi:septal ring factor EnvC (AmiA/AmiB activator)
MKPTIAILSLVCLALAAGLVIRYNANRVEPGERQALQDRLTTYSNQVEEARAKLGEQETLAVYLQSNLTARTTELVTVSNNLNTTALALSQAESTARNANTETQKLNARIAQVEGERDGLQTKLNELAESIKSLNTQISETQRKLAAAEGDRDFLTKELARLQSDKAELVRQFNDVAVVRAQLVLLREESAINQRLTWMSQGVYQRSGMKGAQALLSRPTPLLTGGQPSLDVEIYQDNGTKPDANTRPESSKPESSAPPQSSK